MAEPSNRERYYTPGSIDKYGNQAWNKTGKRIDASVRRSRPMGGGLSAFYALQNPNVRAFADDRFPGQSADEIGADLRAGGAQLNSDGSIGTDRVLSPREQYFLRGGTPRIGSAAQGTGAAETPSNEGGGGMFGSAIRNMQSLGRSLLGTGFASQAPQASARTATPEQNRAALQEIVDAKKMDSQARDGLSRSSYWKNDLDPSIGRYMVDEISGKYGTGSVVNDLRPDRPAGMVKDDFGRMVPIAGEIGRMKENQASNGINPETGAPMAPVIPPGMGGGSQMAAQTTGGQNSVLGSAGKAPLGASDAERFRNLARGGKAKTGGRV